LPNKWEKLKKDELCKELYKLEKEAVSGGGDDVYSSTKYEKNEYDKKIEEILDELTNKADQYLVKDLALYSPKFAKMLELINISEGSSLVYSQFRNVEGIGIFKRVLDANGYTEFKIKKSKNGYELDILEENYNKPKYAEFTGDKEMTTMLLDIFNNNLDNVSNNIKKELNKLHSNKSSEKNDEGNLRGSIIKVMMITQSGSEGISLKNVRQVHLVEPYWNMIRMDQVIGRAARTGSHLALPKNDRNIDVYRYLCKFSDKQLGERKIQRMDGGNTTDQIIYMGAERKAQITNQILELLKSSAIDCYLHKKNHPDVKCFSYPIDINENGLSVKPDIFTEDLDKFISGKEKEIKLSVSIVTIKKKKYAILKDTITARTGQLFDYETYLQFGNLDFVGLLSKNEKGQTVLKMKKQPSNTKSNVKNKEKKLIGDGEILKPNKKIQKMLTKYSKDNKKYEHVIIEHGGGGDCFYCTMASSINEMNKLKNIKKKYKYQDIRNIVADEVGNSDNYTENNVIALYIQEFKNNETNVEDDTNVEDETNVEEDINIIKKKLTDTIKNNKWGTELDFGIISDKFNIGIILIDDNGKLYNMSLKINDFEYYIVVYYKKNSHFQSIAMKEEQDKQYKYLFKCKELPYPIIKLLNKNSEKLENVDKFKC